MRCVSLREEPAHLETLVPLVAQEWAHLYPDWTEEHVRSELTASLSGHSLPETLVALDGQTLLGTVSVIRDDLPGREDLNPWLASLYVLPRHRGCGIGRFLVREAEAWSRKQGDACLYLFTETASPLFESLGWRSLGAAQCHGIPVTILVRELRG